MPARLGSLKWRVRSASVTKVLHERSGGKESQLGNDSSTQSSEARFVRRVVIVLALVGLAMVLWQLRQLLMVVFGAVVIATVFRALADPLRRHLRLPDWAALTAAILLIMTFIGSAFAAFGREVGRQAERLIDSLPAAWGALQARLGDIDLGQFSDVLPGPGDLVGLTSFALSLGGALATMLLVIAAAIYFAAQPEIYRRGLVLLVPKKGRELVDEALGDSGRALAMWLRGQLIIMAAVGSLTGLGLWLLGMPSPLALGLLAGLLDFVPFLGPIAAALPALLIAFSMDFEMGLWTLALYVLVQQVEGNFLYPVVQRYAVGIPPGLMLFALLAGGLLFGLPGVLLGAPLTVVIYVMVKRLYVREALQTPTDVPGEKDGGG